MFLCSSSARVLPVLVMCAQTAACAAGEGVSSDFAHLVIIDEALAIDHPTGEGILRLVNDPSIDEEFLDVDCAIDVRAAARIVAHRRGQDGLDETYDDDPFDDLFELDDVGWVGPSALEALGEVAHQLGLVPVIEVEGVPFSADEEEEVLLLADLGTFEELDQGAGLDARAAESIVGGRPYLGLVELGDQPYVGPSALDQLKAFAGLWIDDPDAPGRD